MNQKITVSAPGKLMLLGEHSVVYGHPCIVTAVDQRLNLTIESSPSTALRGKLKIDASDVGVEGYVKSLDDLGKEDIPKGAKFVEYAVRNFRERFPFDEGLQIVTSSDFSSQFGFGSSSAATVCTIKALSELFDFHLSNRDIFDLSYKTVLDIQGAGSGFDIAAAIYGGTLYFVTGGKTISQVSINHLPLIIGYSGVKADTVTLINKVSHLREQNPELVHSIFSKITNLVEDAGSALEKQDFKQLGGLMNENQTLLSELGVSTEKLDRMIDAALSAGAYGAKLSGAGGGDCIIALCEERNSRSVKDAIVETGGTIIDVKINAKGVKYDS